MRTTDMRTAIFAAGMAGLLLAGCGATQYEVARGSWHLPIGVETSLTLLADDEEAPDELVEFFDHDGEELKPREDPRFPDQLRAPREKPPKPPRPVRPPRVARPEDSNGKWGFASGQLTVVAADYDWPAAMVYSLFKRYPARRVDWELGTEYAEFVAEDDVSITSLLFLRADMLIKLGPARIILGGLGAVETPNIGLGSDAIMGGIGHMGVGVQMGKFDVRWTYNENFSEGANTVSYSLFSAGLVF
jgi:hypothetical protein